MDKKHEKGIAVLLVIAIVFLSLTVLLNAVSSFRFAFEKDGVLFVSNEAQPIELMKEFNLNDTVFVSPVVFESGSANSLLSNASNLLTIVFVGNDKNTVSLWRVIDNNGEPVSCRTNNGDLQKDFELSVADCQNILEDKNNAIVLVSLPRDNGKSRIVFSQNRIEIIPEKIDNVSMASFVFLKSMYANAELIIKKTNRFTEFVK